MHIYITKMINFHFISYIHSLLARHINRAKEGEREREKKQQNLILTLKVCYLLVICVNMHRSKLIII